MNYKIILATALIAIAGNVQAQTKPSAAPAAGEPSAQQLPFNNIPQVCQARERDVVGINIQILMRMRSGNVEKDPAKRAQILAPVQNLRADLIQAESSWSRLDCARILYGAR